MNSALFLLLFRAGIGDAPVAIRLIEVARSIYVPGVVGHAYVPGVETAGVFVPGASGSAFTPGMDGSVFVPGDSKRKVVS